MKVKFVYTISFFFLLFACKQKKQNTVEVDNEIIDDSVAKLPKTKPQNTILIFDIDEAGLEGFRAVVSPKKKGDPLREAIKVFFKESNWKGSYRNVQLNRIGMINRQALFAFSGSANFENKKDKIQFRNALDSTLIHHYKNNRFTVQLNGKPW